MARLSTLTISHPLWQGRSHWKQHPMGVGMKGKGSDFIRHVNLKKLSADGASSRENGSLCQITGSDVP
jgi:hypothetical protein